MDRTDSLFLLFPVADLRFALRLDAVHRVVQMVEVSPLPEAPESVLGVVTVAGRAVPVLALRRRLGLPERAAALSDVLVLAQTPSYTVALPADGVIGVADLAHARLTPAASLHPALRNVKGVTQMDDALVLIYDLDQFLSLEEEACLSRALDGQTRAA